MKLVATVGGAVTATTLLLLGERFAACLALLTVVAVVGSRRGHGLLTPDEQRCFSLEDRRRVFAEAGGMCRYCGARVHFGSDCPNGGNCDRCMEADHVIPWSQGGATTLDNAACVCQRCNLLKSDGRWETTP